MSIDNLIFLEEEILENARLESLESDEISFRKGEEIGYEKGLELGSELGFYYSTCRNLIKEFTLESKPRLHKLLQSIMDLCASFDPEKHLEIDIEALLVELRGKFRAAMATAKLKISHQKDSKMSF